MSTRITILTSWHAARRQSAVTGAVMLTAASFAGYALEAAGGDVAAARVLIPVDMGLFRERVLAALDAVANEEGMPLRAAGGTGS